MSVSSRAWRQLQAARAINRSQEEVKVSDKQVEAPSTPVKQKQNSPVVASPVSFSRGRKMMEMAKAMAAESMVKRRLF